MAYNYLLLALEEGGGGGLLRVVPWAQVRASQAESEQQMVRLEEKGILGFCFKYEGESRGCDFLTLLGRLCVSVH